MAPISTQGWKVQLDTSDADIQELIELAKVSPLVRPRDQISSETERETIAVVAATFFGYLIVEQALLPAMWSGIFLTLIIARVYEVRRKRLEHWGKVQVVACRLKAQGHDIEPLFRIGII
ncbi:MAG: hypothetical protein SGJ03_17145 [Alphaproteobacteria bacterium]|nr:hypothetical protein [Alphaproteobacteria bacterium]